MRFRGLFIPLLAVSVLLCTVPGAKADLSCDAGAIPINGCTPMPGLSGALKSSTYYKYVCSEAGLKLTFKTTGGAYRNDSDLYVKFEDCPTTTNYDGRSENPSTCVETITISSSQIGTYYVMIYGYSAYTNVTLEVQVPPAFDDRATPKVIDSLTYRDPSDPETSVSTRCATVAADDPALTCGVQPGWKGNNTVWYRYTASETGQLQASCVGSNYSIILVAWHDNQGALESVACDYGWSDQHPIISFTATAGESYFFEVASSNLGGGDNLVFELKSLEVHPAHLTITKSVSPTAEVRPGDTLTYTITVGNDGDEPAAGCQLADVFPSDVTYVVGSTTLNGSKIDDGVGDVCPLIAGAAINAPGSEAGVIPGGGQAVVTFRATVNGDVTPLTQITNSAMASSTGIDSAESSCDVTVAPAFDRCSEAVVISPEATQFTGDYNAATMQATSGVISDPVITGCSTGRGYHTVWHRYVPSASGYRTISASLDNGGQGVILAVWTGQCGGMLPVTCDASTAAASVGFQAQAGDTYFIEVASQTATTGTLHLEMQPAGQFALAKSVIGVTVEESGDYLITYELRAWTTGTDSTGSALSDVLPAEVSYVPGSTTLNGVSVEDVSGGCPLIGGMAINSPGALSGIVNQGPTNAAVVRFQVTVPDSLADDYVVHNSASVSGSAGSAQAQVDWHKPPHFDNCAEAKVVTGPAYTDAGSVTNATNAYSDPTHACWGASSYKTVWYSFTPSADTGVDVDAQITLAGGAVAPCLAAVYTGECGELAEVVSAASAGTASLWFRAEANTTYHIEVAALSSAGDDVHFSLNASGREPVTIAQAKLGQLGAQVLLDDVECTGAFNGFFYVEDPWRTNGIRVVSTSNVVRGARLLVSGTVAVSADHECFITADWVAFRGAPKPQAERVRPVCIPARALAGARFGLQPAVDKNAFEPGAGLSNVGMLVRLAGTVRRVTGQSAYLYLDDGTLPPFAEGMLGGVRVYVPSGLWLPADGAIRAVTGISSVIDDSGKIVPVLRMRSGDDFNQ